MPVPVTNACQTCFIVESPTSSRERLASSLGIAAKAARVDGYRVARVAEPGQQRNRTCEQAIEWRRDSSG
eukprot:scaffold10451_cov121-Isochrysis_galbana.AAC.4